jgi:phage-related holin
MTNLSKEDEDIAVGRGDQLCFGPVSSFYDQYELEKFSVIKESDGVFFYIAYTPLSKNGRKQTCGVTLVPEQIKALIQELNVQLKRLER